MDAREGRIEIELTTGDDAPEESGARLIARPVREPERAGEGRRMVTVAALVGVAGLVVGIAIGRSGPDGAAESGSDAASVETTAVRTVVPSRAEPIPPPATIEIVTSLTTLPVASIAPPAPPPTASGNGGSLQVLPTAPGQSSAPMTGVVSVGPTLSGAAIEVIGLSVGGDLVRVDLATGRTLTQEAAGFSNGPPVLYAGVDWVARPSWDDAQGWTIIDDDGNVSRSDLGAVLRHVSDPASGRVWSFFPAGAGGRAIEVNLDGSATGRELDLPGTPEVADPLDTGIVISAPGGAYLVSDEGSARITPGRLLALGRRSALAIECDDSLTCRHVVIDRASGQRQPMTLDPALGDRKSIRSATWLSGASPFDADEGAVIVITSDQFGSGPELGGVLDLDSGEFIEITERGDAAMMRWAPEGRSVLWLDRGRLNVFDVDTRQSTVVAEGLDLFTAFTLRESLPPVDGVEGDEGDDEDAGRAPTSDVIATTIVTDG